MKREKIAKGYEKINVSLNNITLKIAENLWNAYKMTWTSLHDINYDPENPIIIKACNDIIDNKALPTPKESINFNFKIENISRVCLAQITRGRIGWWFNVESQMPEYLNHGVTIPLNLFKSKYKNEILELVTKSQELYNKLAEEKYPPQDLRYLCMHGQQTSLIADCNYVALNSFFVMRTENGLTDELNYVARLMKLRIKEAIENAYKSQKIDNLDYSLWQKMLNGLDCLGSKQKKCLIYDKVFGNTGRFPSGHENVPSKDGKIKPDFDFKKSAWYLELLKLPEELLLPGEKEMIERWKKTDDLMGDLI